MNDSFGAVGGSSRRGDTCRRGPTELGTCCLLRINLVKSSFQPTICDVDAKVPLVHFPVFYCVQGQKDVCYEGRTEGVRNQESLFGDSCI